MRAVTALLRADWKSRFPNKTNLTLGAGKLYAWIRRPGYRAKT